eukprot:gene5993-4303_t
MHANAHHHHHPHHRFQAGHHLSKLSSARVIPVDDEYAPHERMMDRNMSLNSLSSIKETSSGDQHSVKSGHSGKRYGLLTPQSLLANGSSNVNGVTNSSPLSKASPIIANMPMVAESESPSPIASGNGGGRSSFSALRSPLASAPPLSPLTAASTPAAANTPMMILMKPIAEQPHDTAPMNVNTLFIAPKPLGNFHSGNSTFLASFKEALYLVHRGHIRKFPANDNETIVNLRLNPSQVKELSPHHFQSLHLGEDIPVIHNEKRGEPDEIFRVFSLVNKVLQGRLIDDLFFIGRYINPSLVPLHGRFLMATGLAWTLNGINDNRPASEFIEFRWVNHSRYPFYSTETFCGLNDSIHPLPNSGILGQDPRMVAVGPDKVVMVYTNRFEPRPRMGVAEIVYNPVSGMIEAGRILKTLYFNTKTPEKNWSPFVVGDHDVYLIQSINPLTVVGFVAHGPTADTGSTIVASEAPMGYHPYPYGHLRGGTNLIDIGDRYLDDRGMAATVKLKRLLDSMVPVVYCDDPKHPDLHERYCNSANKNNEHHVETGPHRREKGRRHLRHTTDSVTSLA